MPMGAAIARRVLATEQELCGKFVGWLCRLFDCGEN